MLRRGTITVHGTVHSGAAPARGGPVLGHRWAQRCGSILDGLAPRVRWDLPRRGWPLNCPVPPWTVCGSACSAGQIRGAGASPNMYTSNEN
eukprot:scaffold133_cov407-Prasinococcus_capsulatus_cf.AAC.1